MTPFTHRLHWWLFGLAAAGGLAAGRPAARGTPLPPVPPRPAGVVVLDDRAHENTPKPACTDTLTFVSSAGGVRFRADGFTNFPKVGSSHMVTFDPAAKTVWVLYDNARWLRRFAPDGTEAAPVGPVDGTAVAVDQDSGRAWVLGSRLEVYRPDGEKTAAYEVDGSDLVYDPQAKAFWAAGKKLTKLDAATGKVLCAVDVAAGRAVSVDVDPWAGEAWAAVRAHPDVAGSKNQLVKVGAQGRRQFVVELGDKAPVRVSVDRTDGTAWVAYGDRGVEHFAKDGASLGEFRTDARAVQVDAAGGDVWVVTPTEVQRWTAAGTVKSRTKHAAPTDQAWIAAVE